MAKSAPPVAGDVWTWTAIDADTKLIASWMVGDRNGSTAKLFVNDLASRLSNRVQIATDRHNAYLQAIDDAFGIDVDYAILEKVCAVPAEALTRCRPPVCVGANRKEVTRQTAEKSPWHSIKQTVHHNNTDCNTGNNIEKENLRQGTGDKPLCKECERLS